MLDIDDFRMKFRKPLKPLSYQEIDDFMKRILEMAVKARAQRNKKNMISNQDALLIQMELIEIGAQLSRLLSGADLYINSDN